MKIVLRILAISMATALVTLGLSSPSGAAVTVYLQTGVAPAPHGTATVDVYWLGERTGEAGYSIHDWCPGDGKGAYLMVKLWYKDGTTGNEYLILGKDTDGCDNGNTTGFHSFGTSNGKRVDYIRLRLCESNGSPGGWNPCGTLDSDTTPVLDNPLT